MQTGPASVRAFALPQPLRWQRNEPSALRLTLGLADAPVELPNDLAPVAASGFASLYAEIDLSTGAAGAGGADAASASAAAHIAARASWPLLAASDAPGVSVEWRERTQPGIAWNSSQSYLCA